MYGGFYVCLCFYFLRIVGRGDGNHGSRDKGCSVCLDGGGTTGAIVCVGLAQAKLTRGRRHSCRSIPGRWVKQSFDDALFARGARYSQDHFF